jgi:hypothetical protein
MARGRGRTHAYGRTFCCDGRNVPAEFTLCGSTATSRHFWARPTPVRRHTYAVAQHHASAPAAATLGMRGRGGTEPCSNGAASVWTESELETRFEQLIGQAVYGHPTGGCWSVDTALTSRGPSGGSASSSTGARSTTGGMHSAATPVVRTSCSSVDGASCDSPGATSCTRRSEWLRNSSERLPPDQPACGSQSRNAGLGAARSAGALADAAVTRGIREPLPHQRVWVASATGWGCRSWGRG